MAAESAESAEFAAAMLRDGGTTTRHGDHLCGQDGSSPILRQSSTWSHQSGCTTVIAQLCKHRHTGGSWGMRVAAKLCTTRERAGYIARTRVQSTYTLLRRQDRRATVRQGERLAKA